MLGHIKTVSGSIQIAEGVLATLDTQPETMKAVLDPFKLATDLADYFVRKGILFRGGPPQFRSLRRPLKSIDARFEDIAETFNYEVSVEMRASKGGTSRPSVF
ncbi:argininosuccinate lyase [Colletotrichum sp. SAR 10_66]|nr:argininosuccinate lyase [Colletotrichum sp. SAR 10_76]KAJ4997843.1 argininosuccinate lyase [Colletotrichum sp. SAR 10_66]